jgi:hypothetical protein
MDVKDVFFLVDVEFGVTILEVGALNVLGEVAVEFVTRLMFDIVKAVDPSLLIVQNVALVVC